MTTVLVQKLAEVKDLRQILDTAARELGEALKADACQIVLSNVFDPNTTTICNYRNSERLGGNLTTSTFPLVLNAGGVGAVKVIRQEKVAESEANSMRIILGELSDLLRVAQVNDVVQRDTFRNNFLAEIDSVMSYSLGIGDALFMVVNILGKVLHVSRCLFICTDDTQAGWKCYEFWQQDKVQSCQDYRWPTTDSPLVAQVLLSRHPLQIFEGQRNCHISPVQEELELINVHSLLGIALRSQDSVHGCVILQQCDYRRAWTRNEVDMVQHIADRVAAALVKLPAEKRAREPIMQLHQRIVAEPTQQTALSVAGVMRRKLKGAFGQDAIPIAMTTASAQTTSKPSAQSSSSTVPPTNKALTKDEKAPAKEDIKAPSKSTPSKPFSQEHQDSATPGKALKGVFDLSPLQAEQEPASQAPNMAASADPYADLAIEEFAEPVLEDIVSPKTKREAKGTWGDLDGIPTPTKGSGKTGLGVVARVSRGKVQEAQSTALGNIALAFLQKEKSPEHEEAAKVEFVAGPPLTIDEKKAQEKFDELLASPNPRSDYIFATSGLDARDLGRIDGWIAEIETKDKYVHGHACQVAKYACAIAAKLKLSEEEIKLVKQAAIVHDVGKLGVAAQILQKRDEDLTDPELITTMSHPLDGSQLLESFPGLAHLADIVRAHHEEFDGNGYPQGLKGDEIPLAARIIHLANSYHGLVSEMSWGPGMPPAQAREELSAGSAKQYDPAVLSAFLESLQEGID